jgi:tetratricopeptide (TPR) repeat protein
MFENHSLCCLCTQPVEPQFCKPDDPFDVPICGQCSGMTSQREVRQRRKRSLWLKRGLVLAGVAFLASSCLYGFQRHGRDFYDFVWVKTTGLIGMAQPQDYLRVAKGALERHDWHVATDLSLTAQRLSGGNLSAEGSGVVAYSLTRKGDYAGALPFWIKYVKTEKPDHDLLFWYSRSLIATGRIEEAVDTIYYLFAKQTSSVELYQDLVIALKQAGRPYEAVSVLASASDRYPSEKKRWQDLLANLEKTEELLKNSRSPLALKVPRLGGRGFYIPVQIGTGGPLTSLAVEPDAWLVTLDTQFLRESGVQIPRSARTVQLQGSGEAIQAQRFILPELSIAGRTLKNVDVVACDQCQSLLGKQVLKRLGVQEKKINEVTFLKVGRL